MEYICTIEDIRKVFNELDLKTNLNTKDIPIYISNRQKRAFGRVTFRGEKVLKVTFSSLLTDGNYDEAAVRQVIIHEYAHVFCMLTYKRNCGHNDLFYKHCAELGGVPKRLFTEKPLVDKDQLYKYTITCPNCNTVIGYKHRLNVDNYKRRYVCAKCKGKLEVQVNY